MIYIPKHLRVTKDELEDPLSQNDITLSDIVKVHYAYTHDKPDFDGGLNLFDKLKKKLNLYYSNVKNWNLTEMKDRIRNSAYPDIEFMLVLDEILMQDMINCYGY